MSILKIIYRPQSLLAAVFVITLLAYFFAVSTGNTALQSATIPFLVIFGGIWLIYIALSLLRNVRSLIR